MAKQKEARQRLTNNEIRSAMLRYFYARNNNATSGRGKKGSSVKISDVKRELKSSHGLSQQEIQSNLTYLISQGWVKEDAIEKSFTAPGGTIIPSTTNFYTISAAGIDKIEGPGEFTMPKFHGIKIEATGQNIITLGDGNQVDAKFGDLGRSLAELRSAITTSQVPESTKLEFVADIDTIQSQLVCREWSFRPHRVICFAICRTCRHCNTSMEGSNSPIGIPRIRGATNPCSNVWRNAMPSKDSRSLPMLTATRGLRRRCPALVPTKPM